MKIRRKPLQIFVQTPDLKQIRHEFLTGDQTLYDLKRSLVPESLHLSSFYFTLQGKPLPDDTPLSTPRISPLSTLVLRSRLRGGVTDGGGIGAESRGDLNVCAEKKPDSVNPIEKGLNCTLSNEPLREPCVIDKLGNVFNKEALVGALLGKKLPDEFWHINDLNDVITIRLSSIPAGAEDWARFQCPVSGLEFNGKNNFFALRKCGHVLSAKALKEVSSSSCLVCHEGFAEADKIVINASEDEVVNSLKPSNQPIDVQNTNASASNLSSDKEAENIDEAESVRTKRRKVETTEETEGSTFGRNHRTDSGCTFQEFIHTWKQKRDLDVKQRAVVKCETRKRNFKQASVENICSHPGSFGGMCVHCGEKLDGESGAPFGYIHKVGLRLQDEEISRLRNKYMKNLLCRRKLYLVLDLDFTLLNTTHLDRLSSEESHLLTQTNSLGGTDSLFKAHTDRITKLRPFVRTFLKEASEMFEMYIYTMGNRIYALKMAELLDPQGEYFNGKVISQCDGVRKHQKGLDVVPGQENAILIVDDTRDVWINHKDNLIMADRYLYFSSSWRKYGSNSNCKSFAESKTDEDETNGALARILSLLKLVHFIFFDVLKDDLVDRDVRKILSSFREVLRSCIQ